MKKVVCFFLCLVMLTGCHRAKKSVQEQSESSATSMESFDDSYYQIVKLNDDGSQLREEFYLRYGNSNDFQTIGRDLQLLSSKYFSTSKYYMSEGQYISLSSYNNMLKRNSDYSLQPQKDEVIDGVKSPYMVRSLQEQDFYTKDGKNYKLKGISLGVVIDPRDENNVALDESMQAEAIEKYGREVIGKLYNVIQTKEEFEKIKDVPILIAVYRASNTALTTVSGQYILESYCDGTIGAIKKLNFKSVLFTSADAEKIDKTTYNEFITIKSLLKAQAIEAAGFVGEAKYIDNEIQSMVITANLNVKTYTELLDLTSLIADSIDDKFSYDFDCKVLVKSQDELQAVIIKNKGKDAKSYNLY